jgi:chaperonin GroEL
MDSNLNLFGDEVREAMVEAADIIIKAVGPTIGPKGRNVVYPGWQNQPFSTMDGLTVLQHLKLTDDKPFVRAAVDMLKTAAIQSSSVGDGSTTTSLLAAYILKEAISMIKTASPIDIKKGIDKTAKQIIENLEKIAKPVTGFDEMYEIATISANNDSELGELIAKALHEVGVDGSVQIEQAQGMDTYVDFSEGIKLSSGYMSPYFCEPGEVEVVYNNPLIVPVADEISELADVIPLLDEITKIPQGTTQPPIVFICDGIDNDVLGTLVLNHCRKVFKIAIIKADGFGTTKKERLTDIAAVCGAPVYSKNDGSPLSAAKVGELGSCNKIIIGRNETTIVTHVATEQLENRINEINEDIQKTKDAGEISRLKDRLAKLTGGVATIMVAGLSPIEVQHKADLVTDAISATKAACAEGIVPGGGTALLLAGKGITFDKTTEDLSYIGTELVLRAIKEPLMQIARNAGYTPELVIDTILKGLTTDESL